MGLEIIAALVATLVGGLLPLTKKIVENYLKHSGKSAKHSKFNEALSRIFDVKIDENRTYKERLEHTLTVLKNAFSEVDKATVEFTQLMKEKEKNIDLIEARLSELSTEEKHLKNKVETLQQVPLEALSHFEEILNKGDKRSAVRDYMLFISGIVVSVIVTLILKFYFEV